MMYVGPDGYFWTGLHQPFWVYTHQLADAFSVLLRQVQTGVWKFVGFTLTEDSNFFPCVMLVTYLLQYGTSVCYLFLSEAMLRSFKSLV